MSTRPEVAQSVHKNGLAIPSHVAIIMDGNGRWAKRRGLPRLEGHRAGVENVRTVLEGLGEYGVSYVTIYAFSTENWNRPSEEVDGLMEIFSEVIDREAEALHKRNVRIRHLGRLDRVVPALQEAVLRAQKLTSGNTGITLSVAFDYGGRAEIVEAVKRIVKDGIPCDQITEDLFSHYLYTAGLPDPDLVIRTGQEQRVSNFLLWQSAYSEFYFTPTLWPDFDSREIAKAIHDYSLRQRRFGTLPPES